MHAATSDLSFVRTIALAQPANESDGEERLITEVLATLRDLMARSDALPPAVLSRYR